MEPQLLVAVTHSSADEVWRLGLMDLEENAATMAHNLAIVPSAKNGSASVRKVDESSWPQHANGLMVSGTESGGLAAGAGDGS